MKSNLFTIHSACFWIHFSKNKSRIDPTEIIHNTYIIQHKYMQTMGIRIVVFLFIFASNWIASAATLSHSPAKNHPKLLPAQQQHIDLTHIKQLTMQQLPQLMKDEDILIVDARSFSDMTKALIKDSIWIGFFSNNTWNGWFKNNIDDGQQIVLYGSLDELKPVVEHLERIGKRNIVGRIDFDVSDWKGKKMPCEEPEFIDEITEDMKILDVREPFEWKRGIIKGSTLIQLKNVVNAIEKFDEDETYVLVCRTGCRANIAMRILKPFGLKLKVFNHKFQELFKYEWCQRGHY